MAEVERLAHADDGAVDDEFLQHLYQGGELLSAGKVPEARDVLEQAFRLQPKNPKAQNLLGLAYFKLGTFDRAAEIYELLVRDNPMDPTLRVNLGLVYLKLNALPRATREFETAVDLSPDHKKAQNYLGLAYAQAGEYARAKDCFVAAGSLTMAEKMERALKDPAKAPRMPPPEAVRAPEAAPAAVEPPPAEPERAEPPADEPRLSLTDKIRAARETSADIDVDIDVENGEEGAAASAAAPAAEPQPEPEPLKPAVPEPVAAPAPAAEAHPEQMQVEPLPAEEPWPALSPLPPAPPLGDLARSIGYGQGSGAGPFDVGPDAIRIRVEREVLTRLDGLLAVSGPIQLQGEMKRFRGRATDKGFGEGERRVVRASGTGSLLIAPKGRTFAAFELNEESAYFREDLVFAFEDSVVFENGRVPSKVAPDLHLVHLRGQGKVLVCVSAALRSVAVTPGVPCRVPLETLVGWHGNLTPRIVGLPEDQEGAPFAAVELVGEGFALLVGVR